MASLPGFLSVRQVPYAAQPPGLGAYGQQAYRLAGAPPAYNQRPYTLDAPLAPFPTSGGGGSSGSDSAGLAGGLLAALAQNPQALSSLTDAAKKFFGGSGASPAQFPGSMLDTAQKAGSLAEALPGAANYTPTTPNVLQPGDMESLRPTSVGSIPTPAQYPGSMLSTAQSGAPLSGLLSPSAIADPITPVNVLQPGDLAAINSPPPAMASIPAPGVTFAPDLSSLSSLAGAGGGGAAGAGAAAGATAGLGSLGTLGGLTSTGLGSAATGSLAAAAAPGASLSGMLGASGSIASQAGGMGAALGASGGGAAATGTAAAAPAAAAPSAGLGALGTAGAAAGLLAGGAYAADSIGKGKEGRAAVGGAVAAASAGYLAGLTGLAALGPIGLVGAGVAALAATLTNTKEFGDKAFANYWNGVEQGRGVGESDPVELAQGFVNLYRTNKMNFPGQYAYGRKGNEDFLFDMTQQINGAVTSGAVPPDSSPGTIYEQVVKPWMSKMGGGSDDERLNAVQDHMMTDLIHSYQKGQPISNAQVKNDSKYRIVSERPVYPGAAPSPQPSAAPPVMAEAPAAEAPSLSSDMFYFDPSQDGPGTPAADVPSLANDMYYFNPADDMPGTPAAPSIMPTQGAATMGYVQPGGLLGAFANRNNTNIDPIYAGLLAQYGRYA